MSGRREVGLEGTRGKNVATQIHTHTHRHTYRFIIPTTRAILSVNPRSSFLDVRGVEEEDEGEGEASAEEEEPRAASFIRIKRRHIRQRSML